MLRSSLAGLDVTVVQETKGPPTAAVILCHGFGAPGDDLVPLQAELVRAEPALASVRFVFPEAPLSLGDQGWGDSRAWWMIDLEALAALQRGDAEAVRRFRATEPPGLPAARRQLSKLVLEIATLTDLPLRRIALGGFSQGAMLATDVALRLEEPPAGLLVLSGTLLIEAQWRARAVARAGLPVFQSHGRGDPLLSFHAAEQLRDALATSGLAVEFHAFEGGHGIGPTVLPALAAFLARALAR
jgi:phospholipase/carboxylesterase